MVMCIHDGGVGERGSRAACCTPSRTGPAAVSAGGGCCPGCCWAPASSRGDLLGFGLVVSAICAGWPRCCLPNRENSDRPRLGPGGGTTSAASDDDAVDADAAAEAPGGG